MTAKMKLVKQVPVLDTVIQMCWINNSRDTNPKPESVSIRELSKQFLNPQTNPKKLKLADYLAADKPTKHKEKDGPAFIPAIFTHPKTRTQANVKAVTAFVLDFDGDVSCQEFEPKLKPFGYIAYTTYSHSPTQERWRVIVFYASPATAAEHRLIYQYFHKLFQGRLDNRSKTTNQLWYAPACPQDASKLYQKLVNDAPLLIPSAIAASEGGLDQGYWSQLESAKNKSNAPPDAHQEPPSSDPDSDKRARVIDALRHICADDRAVWIRVGIALKYADVGNDACKIWLEWSKSSDKYDEDDAIYNWESFKPKEQGVTLGTVYYLAQQAGWKSPPSVSILADLAELNADHFVARENGKTCVFREKNDAIGGRKYLERMTPKDVTDFYRNRSIPTTGKKRIGLGEYWLNHPERRQYSDVIFAPNQEIPGAYNLWRGFSVEAVEGNWSKMQYHIRYVICADNEELYQYVLGWMACAIQHPDRPGEVALVLQGASGAGKGSFAHSFGRLFGQHYMQITQPKHLVGNFNAHLRDCTLLFADEAFFAGDHQGGSTLKALITEPTIMIEPKGVNSFSVSNYLHIIMASNSDWVVPAGPRERRYCVLQVSDMRAQDSGYFAALKLEMESGGFEAMLYELLNMDISKFNVRKIPFTVGLREQMLQSLTPEVCWWYEELKKGELWMAGSKEPPYTRSTIKEGINVGRDTLYQDFAEACKRLHTSRSGRTQLGILLKKHLPIGWPRTYRDPKNSRYYGLPPLEEARAHFERVTGLANAFLGDM